jgi:hypothetical protein
MSEEISLLEQKNITYEFSRQEKNRDERIADKETGS